VSFDSISRRTFLKAGTGAVTATGFQDIALAYNGENSEKSTQVTIRRDGYGVPHVYAPGADSPEPTFYGFGYALAEDRLYQLEMHRRFYHGTVSAVLGSDWIEFDKQARVNRSIEPNIETQIETLLPEDQREVVQAFVDGINRFIEHVEETNRSFHRGFIENDFRPDEWTVEDAVGIFVATLEFFSNFQLETLDAAVLNSLKSIYDEEKAHALFADIQWGNDPSAPTSAEQPDVGYTPPYTPAGDEAPDDEEPTVTRLGNGTLNAVSNAAPHGIGPHRIPTDPEQIHAAEMERLRTLAQGRDALGLPIKLGSNALAVRGDLTESGNALLYGGPQMGFSSPSVMYEIGLHGPDFDVTGSTVAGFPFVMFGHNGSGAFTSTAGLDNAIQTFVESIETDAGDGPRYRFQGDLYPVETHTETIPVDGAEDATVTIRRTRHGIVTTWKPEKGEAIARTRGYAGMEVLGLRSFYETQFASDVEEFEEAATLGPHPINYLWADESGDIGYFHLGRYPDPNCVDWDLRLPADGTQYELTENEFRSALNGETPFTINPERGYIPQWNNKPVPDWGNGDLSYAWGTDHRVQRITNLVEHRLETEGSISYEFMKEIVYDIAFVDLRAIRYKQPLLDALADADLTETEAAARDALQQWNDFQQASGEDYLGTYPPGYTIFDAFFPKLLDATFSDEFGKAYEMGKGTFFNYRYGRPVLMRALHPEEAALKPAVDYFGGDRNSVMRDAFTSAVEELQGGYGDDVSSWRADAIVDELDNLALFGMPIGVGDAGNMPFMNRGTENHFVRLDQNSMGNGDAVGHFHAENILPPGNSGYVFPDGTLSKHYADQLDEFIDFEYKPFLFTKSQVARNQESIERLRGKEGNPQNVSGNADEKDESEDESEQ
jgi:penicillin amidase